MSTINSKHFAIQKPGKLPELKIVKGKATDEDEGYNDEFSVSPKGMTDAFKHPNYSMSKHSRRDGSQQIVKKSSSGFRDIKNSKNFSVDVREYFHEGAKKKEDFKIPITQNHGKNRRGLNKNQLESQPEDLTLLFYNFNNNSRERISKAGKIPEEQPEFEEDFELGPTNCKIYFKNFILC